MSGVGVVVPEGCGLSPQEYADRATGLYGGARAEVAAHARRLAEARADVSRKAAVLAAAVEAGDPASVEAGMVRLFTLGEAVLTDHTGIALLHRLLGTPAPAHPSVEIPGLAEESLPPYPELPPPPPPGTNPTALLSAMKKHVALIEPIGRERLRLTTGHFLELLGLLPESLEQPDLLREVLAAADGAWALWHGHLQYVQRVRDSEPQHRNRLLPPTLRQQLDGALSTSSEYVRVRPEPCDGDGDEEKRAAERERHQRQIAMIDRYARAADNTGIRFRAFMDHQLALARVRRIVKQEHPEDFGVRPGDFCGQVELELLAPAYRTTDTNTLLVTGRYSIVSRDPSTGDTGHRPGVL